jgi:hypothetical protein
MVVKTRIRFVGHFEPSKSKDIANLLAETDPQTLRAGIEVGPLQIVKPGLVRRLAEYRQQSSRKQTEKRVYLSAKSHARD